MKTMKTLALTVAALLSLSVVTNAQFGDLKNTKDKVEKTTDKINIGGGKNSENKSGGSGSSTENVGSASATTISVSADEMKPGSGYFYTSFKPNGFKNQVSIGDELFVRMNLGKTMVELAADNGLESSYTAYGFVVAYIDGQKVFTAGPYSFASNISKQWKYIDIPLNVNPDFAEKLAADNSLLETNQDVWVFQHLYQEKNVPVMYTTAAIGKMKSGTHELKIEFALANSGDSEPKATVCTGTVSIGVDEAGSNALALSGPKHLRPLKDNEKGNFVFSQSAFSVGNGELSVNLKLPNAPKFYNMKWCKASSCDYDHGAMSFYASIDGIPVAAWDADLWDADYETRKDFSMIILPATDAGYGDMSATYNTNTLYKGASPVVYALLDMIYGGKLGVGNHKLTIKAYSQECVPYDVSYEFIDSYFSQWPAIAENTIEFNITQDGLNKMMAASSAKPLSHAGGEWTAIDTKLKASNTGGIYEVVDVACQTEWKVVTNSLGVILYRECKADVIYKCEYGYRLQKRVAVKADYMGSSSYGAPYFNERIEASHGPSLLGTMHLPVPAVKIK
jgi:hypothetical protein